MRTLGTAVGIVGALATLAGCAVDAVPSSAGHEPKSEGGSLGAIASKTRTTDPTLSGDCAAGTTVPYVMSDDGDLHQFDPAALTFSTIGRIGCDLAEGDRFNSMAIDRKGRAWVSSAQGALMKVNIEDASCEVIPRFATASFGFRSLGMGFAADSTNGNGESLFVADIDTTGGACKGMGGLTSDLQFKAIGDYSSGFGHLPAELTGTGDGRLFAFLADDATHPMSSLVRLDKHSAAVLETVPLTFPIFDGFAFNFWGGDFWFYTSPTEGANDSQVIRLRYSGDKTSSVVMPSVGFNIVGAGVSTCAPTSAASVK